MKIQSYAAGEWVSGKSEGKALFNAINGEVIGHASSEGVNFQNMLSYAKQKGGSVLRKMTFQQRGQMLKALALHLNSKKDIFYKMSYATGATKVDSWIDIEGGIGNLFSYASLRKQFPDEPFYVEGDTVNLSKGGSFVGHHILVPKPGVAVHINAFNFPCWGMLEKIAVNLLAGVPAIVKPATITCYLTELMVREIVNSNILPEGALQLISGGAGDILDHVTSQDIVTFTGSATTAKLLKSHPNILGNNIPFNAEADSLNACILGEDVTPESEEFKIFIKEVTREMTVKAGQKCTAIRRIIIPENLTDAVSEALKKRLSGITIGDPQLEGVRMGALAGKEQVEEVSERVNELLTCSSLLFGSLDQFDLVGATKEAGAFLAPMLLHNEKPLENQLTHNVEAFGPVSTIMPYKGVDQAIELANLGKGSLVSSIITADDNLAKDYILGAATHHGRILILNKDCAKESTGHGSPMPLLTHGGPGRAGGGEEMGGKRGVLHYMQRTAIQGHPTSISKVTNQYQYGAHQEEKLVHVFRKHFEDLEIGETVITHKRTITEGDIVNFANISGDNFYAHMDVTSLEGTLFEDRVAHGYFILSAAAGLFVDPKKGPVLLNYGLEECRFVKPVYPGATIGVRLTVKEKIAQEKRSDDDVPKGIVKFLVDVYDETGETVAIATILTMVKKLEDS